MNPLHFLIQLRCRVVSRIRNMWFRTLGVQIKSHGWIQKISIPRNWGDICLEGNVSLDDGVVLLCSGASKKGKIYIKSGTYINRFTMIDAHEHVEIGNDCMIGPFCYLTDSDHGKSSNIPIGKQPMVSRPTVLENNVWLGAGVVVLKGVRIGCNVVVGAGAVVTKDVPRDTVVVGVPARHFIDRK